MENTKKVAWSDWEEWKRCWVLLQTDPLLGLDMLEMWGIRDTLPVRVECTDSLNV